jgi:hypothetical protein
VPEEPAPLAAAGAASRVALPPYVRTALEVYVNGVRQEPGRDYVADGRTLLFSRPLAHEGRLGFWRWARMFLGVAGSYRKHEQVDVLYEVDGRRLVATGLPVEPL